MHFDIALQEDGSALITETREILFTGDHEFSRYGVNNVFVGPRVFSDWQVDIDGTPISQLDEPDNENRPENTFAVEDNNEGNTVHIYFRQQGSGTRIIQIGYRMENAVKFYSDVGEFFWNLTAESGISDIGTLTAALTVPEGVPSEDFLIRAHGPLNGTFEKLPDGSAALYVENVPLGTIVDIRSTMPAYCFYGGLEQQGEALPDILTEEKERWQAEEEAYWAEREAWESNHPILSSIENFCMVFWALVQVFLAEHGILVLVIIVFAFPLLIFTGLFGIFTRLMNKVKIKRFRKHPAQTPEYYEHLPDDRPAPVVDRLLHFYDRKSSVSRQFSAAMLELNFKRLIRFRTVLGDTEILLDEKLGADMFPNAEPTAEHSPSYLEALWNFLRNAADGNGCISIKNIQKHIKDDRDAALKFRGEFRDAVEREYIGSAFYEAHADVKGDGDLARTKGLWKLDGETDAASIEMDGTGGFTMYYASGAVESSGYIECVDEYEDGTLGMICTQQRVNLSPASTLIRTLGYIWAMMKDRSTCWIHSRMRRCTHRLTIRDFGSIPMEQFLRSMVKNGTSMSPMARFSAHRDWWDMKMIVSF